MKSTLRKIRVVGPSCAIFCLLLCSTLGKSQSPVLQFTTNYVPASSPVSNYNSLPASPGTFSSCIFYNYSYTWSNGTSNHLKLTSFTANSKSYIVSQMPGVIIKLRRVNNLNVTGTRNILYSESTASTATACVSSPRQLNFKAPYIYDMTAFLNDNVLNQGTDNIFTNANNGDGNNNNIERVDVIFTNGISASAPSDVGFILCERGNNNAHDGFRIAAILSKNGSNDPTSFGAVKTCVAGNGSNNGSWGHPSIANGNRQLAAYVLRKDALDPFLRVSSNVNQEIGGVFFSLADLGVAPNQIIYGYSLIGPDGIANPSSAQLLDIYNTSVYPTNTTEAQGGGLDLIAVNTFFGTNQALASSIFSNFSGTAINSGALLTWTLNSVADGTAIELQRSTDGISYSTIHSYISEGHAGKQFRDEPGQGRFYYRLRIVTGAGTTLISKVIMIRTGKDWQALRIYPTITAPGRDIIVDEIEDGLYSVVLRNNSAAIVLRTMLRAQNGKATIHLPEKQMAPGIYHISFEKKGFLSRSSAILIQ